MDFDFSNPRPHWRCQKPSKKKKIPLSLESTKLHTSRPFEQSRTTVQSFCCLGPLKCRAPQTEPAEMQSAGSHCLEYKNATYCASLLSRTPFFPKQTASCEPHARRTDRTSKLCHAITILLVPTCRLQLPQHCPGSHRTVGVATTALSARGRVEHRETSTQSSLARSFATRHFYVNETCGEHIGRNAGTLFDAPGSIMFHSGEARELVDPSPPSPTRSADAVAASVAPPSPRAK